MIFPVKPPQQYQVSMHPSHANHTQEMYVIDRECYWPNKRPPSFFTGFESDLRQKLLLHINRLTMLLEGEAVHCLSEARAIWSQ
jgi:hypothetical protein